ncbi:MAG TPA: hypothetical protein VNW68_04765, partial [Candidatus Limnocylindria bacterium]|nr:hypothetical protein [Candidatus Limnocylindria bacterium]
MSDLHVLRRVALGGIILALIVGAVSVALGIAAVGDIEALTFGHVDTILRAGPEAAVLWRWSMLLDMFYSYLLLAPLALYGHRLLRERKPWLADLGLAGALAYISIGAASAASLAIAGSALIESYATASPEQQTSIVASFMLLRDIFYFAIWQTLDPITAGTWVFATGWLLLADRRWLGRLLVVLGSALWTLAAMTMLGVHSLAVLALIFGVA